MTTYNTGNPVPSADARDRFDNSQTFDQVINGGLTFYPNRVGSNVLSLTGMQNLFNAAQADRVATFNALKEAMERSIASGGYFKDGAYAAGLVITSHNQYVEVGGLAYTLIARIPVPYTVSGNWETESVNFKLVGDDSLRTQLPPIVDHFGADPTGTTSSTAAFVASGPGSYVPQGGVYDVDASTVDVLEYFGEGEIAFKGNRINIGKRVFEGRAVQRLGASPLFGWTSSGPDVQLYPGAGNATQGLAWVRVGGVEKLFITQRVSGTGAAEMCRISEWNWVDNGSDMVCVAFSAPLSIGHGSMLTAFVEGSNVYLYTTWHNTGTIGGGASLQGKGFSKVLWKGAATAQSDVQAFRVFGDPTDTDGATRLTWPQSASGCVTMDGRHVVLVTTSFSGSGRFFFVYDRAAVEAAGSDARRVLPLIGPVPFERGPGEFGSTCQGVASDGKFVYVVWGLGAPRAARTIQVYDMYGRLLRSLPFAGAAALYTENELMGLGTRGIPVSFEPEGICIRGAELISLTVDGWKTPQDVVSFEGRNWACINTKATAGREPTNRSNWVETALPATTTFNVETPYVAGAYSFRQKRVMRVMLATGAAGEIPLQLGTNDTPTGTMKEYYAGTDIAYNAENGSFTIAKFYEAIGTYKKFMELNYDNNLNLFSTAPGTPNNRWVSIKSAWDAAMYGLQLRSSGGNAAGGANIDLHAFDCPSAPGELTCSSTEGAVIRGRNGSLTSFTAGRNSFSFFVDTEVRSTTDKVVRLGGLNNNWRAVHSQEYCVDVSTCRIMSGFGNPEGDSAFAASVGSLYLRRDPAAAAWLYVKQSGTGNTGWVAK